MSFSSTNASVTSSAISQSRSGTAVQPNSALTQETPANDLTMRLSFSPTTVAQFNTSQSREKVREKVDEEANEEDLVSAEEDEVDNEDEEFDESSESSNEYEKRRLENIRRRQEVFQSLGLDTIKEDINKSVQQAALARKRKRNASKQRALAFIPRRRVKTRSIAADDSSESSYDEPFVEKGRRGSQWNLPRDVERDENGAPKLPLHAPTQTVKECYIHSLGKVDERPTYHAKNYIWPVGFVSYVTFGSCVQRGKKMQYKNEILDGGDDGPLFKVTPVGYPDRAVTERVPTPAWMKLLRKIRGRDKVSISGPEMFGYSNKTVRMLIEELPNASKCTEYEFRYKKEGVTIAEDEIVPHEPPPPVRRYKRMKMRIDWTKSNMFVKKLEQQIQERERREQERLLKLEQEKELERQIFGDVMEEDGDDKEDDFDLNGDEIEEEEDDDDEDWGA